MDIKQFVSSKRLDYAFSIAAFALSLTTLILYIATGTNMFVTELSAGVLVAAVITVVLGAFTLVWEIKFVKYAMFITALAAWLKQLTAQINYITNVIVAIDGTALSAAFIATAVLGALAWACALVAAILQKGYVGALPFEVKKESAGNE